MATMPSRASTAPLAIASILRQVSKLWLFLDRFDAIPDYARSERIAVVRSQDVGDIRANGQLIGLALDATPCTFFPTVDDIDYPSDYCATLESSLSRLRSPAVVGVHAAALRDPTTSYRADTKVFHYRSPQAVAQGVDLLGSGTMSFRTSTLSFDVRAWTDVNMVDLSFARVARTLALPLVMIPRPAHWISALDEDQEDGIWTGLERDEARQTELSNEIVALPRPALPRLGSRRLEYRDA